MIGRRARFFAFFDDVQVNRLNMLGGVIFQMMGVAFHNVVDAVQETNRGSHTAGEVLKFGFLCMIALGGNMIKNSVTYHHRPILPF